MALISIKWVEDDRNKKILYESRGSGKKKTSKKGLMLDWVKRYRWDIDPFKDEILEPVSDFMFGYDDEKKKLNVFLLQDGRFGIIKGNPGSGKTALLLWLRSELMSSKESKTKYDVVYLSAKQYKKGFIDALVRAFSSFSIFGKQNTPKEAIDLISGRIDKKKHILVLIDDAQELDTVNAGLIKSLLSELKNISFVISMDSDAHKTHGMKDISKDEIDIELKGLAFDAVHETIKRRIEHAGGIDIDPFSVVQLKTMTKKANGNPREILSLCAKKAAELALMGADPEAKDADIDQDELKELEAELAVYNKNNPDKAQPANISKGQEIMSGEQIEVKPAEDSKKEKLYAGDRIVQEVLGKSPKDKKEDKDSKKDDEKEKKKAKKKR